MRIIDLLNKIANEAEVPKKIKYEGEIYEFNKNIHGYWGGKNKDSFRAMVNWRYLNNEVEILEEEKKIPEKLGYQDNADGTFYLNRKKYNSEPIKILSKKMNEIIDYLDYLKNKGDE